MSMRTINVAGEYIYDSHKLVRYESEYQMTEAGLCKNLGDALEHIERLEAAVAYMRELQAKLLLPYHDQ
jgi:hypothetical protein